MAVLRLLIISVLSVLPVNVATSNVSSTTNILSPENSILSTTKFCDPLTAIQHGVISCTYNNTKTDCSTRQQAGTVAKTECDNFYIPFESVGKFVGSIRCGHNGKWQDLKRFNSLQCIEDCGKRLVNPKPLVVFGTVTNATSWPWHAGIFYRRHITSDFSYICGGTIIRNRVILTAAHCVTKPGTKEPGDSNLYRVIVGTFSSNYTDNIPEYGSQEFEVEDIYVKEQYDPRKDFQSDIAILKLKTQMTFTDFVRPVCLPYDSHLDFNAIKTGKHGDVVGFGIDETGNLSNKLKHSALDVKSIEECYSEFKQTLTESQFCAGNYNKELKQLSTVCNGDSGGGYVYASSLHGKYFVHGIVSTGGSKIRYCETLGVFTRIFQFIFWIRDILDLINGAEIRELLSATNKLDYVVSGRIATDGTVIWSRFTGIPREWEHIVSAVLVNYSHVDPQLLTTSLQATKRLEHINITRVILDKPIADRVRLPYIRSVVLHILMEDLKYGIDDFPLAITETYLKSLLFFDKDYDEQPSSWEIGHITKLGVDIELTVNAFKLLSIKQGTVGTISLSNIPFASEMIGNITKEFNIEHLALHKCNLTLEHLQSNELKNSLRKLVLNKVIFTRAVSNNTTDDSTLGATIEHLEYLEDLRVFRNDPSPFYGYGDDDSADDSEHGQELHSMGDEQINLADIPYKRLKRLSLGGNIGLTYDSVQNNNTNTFFPVLESFACFKCKMDANVIGKFPWIFQNIKHLFLQAAEIIDVRLIVEQMGRTLETIYLTSTKAGNYDYKIKDNYVGLEFFQGYNSTTTKGGVVLLQRGRTTQGSALWTINPIPIEVWEYLKYMQLGRDNFWTTWHEYSAKTPLVPFELDALVSGHYIFDGSNTEGGQYRLMTVIPQLVHEKLKSITIQNAQVIPEVLLQSLLYAHKLESLVLDNVKLLGVFSNKVGGLYKLQEYKLNRVSYSTEFLAKIEFDHVDLDAFYSMMPFTERVYENYPITITMFEKANKDLGIIYRAEMYSILELKFENCITFFMDKDKGELILAVNFGYEMLSSLANGEIPKRPIKKLAIYRTLFSANSSSAHVISNTVLHLNMDSIELHEVNQLRTLLQHLANVQDLRVVNTKLSSDPGMKEFVFNLNILNSMRTTLEYLELESKKVTSGSDTELIQFPKVKVAYFNKCSFSKAIISEFLTAFPAVEYLVIKLTAASYDQAKGTRSTTERLLLEILKDPTQSQLNMIYYASRILDINKSTYLKNKELENVLTGFGLVWPDKNELNCFGGYYFETFLVKINGNWTLKYPAKFNCNEFIVTFPAEKWTSGHNFGESCKKYQFGI